MADDYWHVTDYYENIRNNLKNLDPSKGFCEEGIKDTLPARICKTPMKGRSQYTPRANFHETGLNTIVKPTADGYVPKNEKVALYEGPDAHNDCYDVPAGEVDVLAIVSGRRRHLEESISWNSTAEAETAKMSLQQEQRRLFLKNQHRKLDDIVPGKGWQLVGEPQGTCDGEFYSVCGRSADNYCVLSGHHDSRAVLVGTALSGWLVMTVKGVKEGIIVLKLQSWNKAEENSLVSDWKTVNNERRYLEEEAHLSQEGDSERRNLASKDPADKYPDNFVFEYAVNGKVTRLTKAQYIEQRKLIQRAVETIVVLDDPNFTNEETDVEVAVRILECGNECAIGVTHIYWA